MYVKHSVCVTVSRNFFIRNITYLTWVAFALSQVICELHLSLVPIVDCLLELYDTVRHFSKQTTNVNARQPSTRYECSRSIQSLVCVFHGRVLNVLQTI